jgi:hypothetical protein
MANKVSNQALLEAGLAAMHAIGQPMQKMQTNSRAMKYHLSNGETVRARTCNDHVLVVLADSTDESAALNIEGTDHLLIVMPEVPRTEGSVIVYFVPTIVAVKAVRMAHADWLASKPSTKGNNRTWNIWFDDAPAKSGGFARIWSQYRLPTKVLTATAEPTNSSVPSLNTRPLGAVIAEARKAIAEAAGVAIDAVKITVALD